jgi:hypothetical protein
LIITDSNAWHSSLGSLQATTSKMNSNNSCFDHYAMSIQLGTWSLTLWLSQELSYCCMVCYCLRPKIMSTMLFPLVILSTVALFIIVIWDRSSYINLFMFDGLVCLSFLGYRSHRFRLFSIYFPIDYYHFRNYQNIDDVFLSDNIAPILFLKKIWKQKWFGLIDYFGSFSSLNRAAPCLSPHANAASDLLRARRQVHANCGGGGHG